ncbi:hypothetical protein [Bacillus kwashiorkori]|uniref:hypothetical protein n=1 Tax=Bacillus kwashiorkori TaxID=1522318 RepID=UPI0007860623|nr:hypothetical protein [Bacillus kwashiorkori]
MFDPTAYENLKVVLEGNVYDFDLEGKIVVIERNDIVNLADLSRSFTITYRINNEFRTYTETKIELFSSFKQQASEWYSLKEEAGANLKLYYYIHHPLNEILEKRVLKFIKQKYMRDFTMESCKLIYSDQTINYRYVLEKNYLLTEDKIDEITNFVVDTTTFSTELEEMILKK